MQDISPSNRGKVVRVDWKLPSRLSKPFRKKRKVAFRKKAIATPKVWEVQQIKKDREHSIQLPSSRFFSHTNDIVKQPASISLTPPPYTGKGTPVHGVTKQKLQKRNLRTKKNISRVAPKVHARAIPKKMKPKKVEPVQIHSERDVPYRFPAEERVVAAPAATISLPKGMSSGIAVSAISFSRHHAVAVGVLLVGFAVASFMIWNLQGVGRVTSVLSSIQAKVAGAFEHVSTAQSALADTNVAESQKQFAAASDELKSAKAQMDEALAASKSILQTLDVTGTVRAGSDLLDVGTALSDAGGHISKAVEPFLSVTLETPLVDAIVAATPELNAAREKLAIADEKLSGIQTTFLPEDVKAQIAKLQTIVPTARKTLDHLTQESGTLLALLGAERDRQYLFLFANNDELRPVGGFIGTVGLINVGRGKVENIDVRSVYDGDGQLKKFLAPPNPLLPIVNRWFLRDSNWFVDYRTDAKKAAQLFEKEGGPTVDGVIMMTPQVIKNLLKVTGPITVPGYDVAVSADNFSKVTQGEVTYNYDKTVNKPKQFLADLTPLLLTKLFSASGDSQVGDTKLKTLEALTTSLEQKDLLLYFADEKAESEALNLGWAGAIVPDVPGFLMVNNANIGGHKSDQFMEQEIDYRTTIADNGDADVVLTVRRTHKGPQEKINYPYPPGEDPAFKDNVIYQRTLVPNGAKLIEAKGFTSESQVPRPELSDGSLLLEADPDVVSWQQHQVRSPDGTTVGLESGYTFFANWVVTKPGQTSVTLYHYTIPHAVRMPSLFHRASSYSLGIAKQAGQGRTNVRASITIPSAYRIVDSVPSSGGTRESDQTYTYRGELTSDIVPGIVFEK